MINEVMKEIAEAEKKAEEIIAAARERAGIIRYGAAEEVEQVKKEYAARLKEELYEIEKKSRERG